MTLYAARGGNIASNLYTVDPTNATETIIGNTGRGITGLAFDPTDGTLYGSTSNNSPLNARSLVTVDPTTAATTLVGSFGIVGDTLADIAFDSTGVLYGYSAAGHQLYTVNKGTGSATLVSATSISGGFGFAMDFDSEENLFVLPKGDNPTTGQVLLVDQSDASNEVITPIGGSPPFGTGAAFAAGTFVPAKTFYAIDNNFGVATNLVTVNPITGIVADVGSLTAGMDALASDTRATSALIYTYAATSIINASSPTASVVSGRVREDWRDWWDFGSNGYNLPQKTLHFTWTHDPGTYLMTLSGQLSANGNGPVDAIVSINGRPFLGSIGTIFNNTTPDTWYVYNGLNNETRHVLDADSDFDENPWLVLGQGDTVEIQILSTADLTGLTGFNPFEVDQVRFLFDDTPGETATCTPSIRFHQAALGDDWGDVDGWGGQRLIPDQIYAELGYTPDSHVTGSEFPWGVNQVDFDFMPLSDGTVYVILRDSMHFAGDPASPPAPGTDRHFVVVKKYDPNTELWTQIATLNISNPNQQKMASSVTCETDGTFIYFAWWEVTTYTSGVPETWQSDWHLVRLDPSNDSITELGTGQHSVTVGTGASDTQDNAEMNGVPADIAPMICPISDDNIFVGVVELVTTGPALSGDQWRRPFLWHWDGAAWTDLNVPDPSLLGPDPTEWEITGENGFWDQLTEMVAADQNGLITNGMTLVYSYIYNSASGFRRWTVTIPYTTGGGWGTEILTDWMAVGLERARQQYNPSITDPTGLASLIDHSIMWSDRLGKLVLAGDLLFTSSGNIWDMWQMNDAGTQWENLVDIAPANNAGGWRQSRNTTAIGPDGEFYRGTISDDVANALNFQPHVIKHSAGYAYGYADAARYTLGRKDDGVADPQGNVWTGGYMTFFSTTHFRIRWAGNTCYIMGNLYNEPQLVNDTLFADYVGDWPFGEGFWVIPGDYVPCGGSIPLFRPRVFSVSATT